MAGLPRGVVRVVAYRPVWKSLFEEEAARLRSLMGAAALAVEHAGSTAVEGMDAKPIIDLLVGVRDLEEARGWIPKLEARGYEFRPDADTPDRLFFAKGSRSLRTHHLSLAEPSSGFYTKHLRFRDYLRAHPAACEEYRALKHRLARAFPTDRASYTEGKSAFIKHILELAAER
jgi:GrpB-like predicted nucleotidyltransferase (UPF0157 family)